MDPNLWVNNYSVSQKLQTWAAVSSPDNHCIYWDGHKIYDQNNKSNKLHLTYIFHNKIFWLTLWYQVIILSFV